MYILGISAYYHDSAAVLIKDGNIVAAAQEERFTRKKHDDGFPRMAAEYCLKEAGIDITQLEHVVFYDKPILKFDRLLETYLSYVPGGWISFRKAIPLWLSKKFHLPKIIKKELGWKGKVLFTEHHESHAASAFFPSPFEEAAVICFDGVGEWATTTWGVGKGNRVEIKQQISFPHSLGLLYSAFTYYTGFKVNSGEYKVMGLAPYGVPKYVELIMNELIDIKEDGSFRMNMKEFNYCQGLTMTNRKFSKLFGGPPRKPEKKITQREMDIAASIQKVTEEIVLRIGRFVYDQTGQKNLCMAGGVALNCVSNGRLLRDGPFENIWVQPSAGDAGGALGTALAIWHHYLDMPREVNGKEDRQYGSYLGPHFDNNEIKKFLDENGYPYREYNEEALYDDVAKRIETGEAIGWFQGKMEFGPRALGARSIIGDARNPDMQKKMNLKIKNRESFRPFAPSILLENVSEWFEHDKESPYMLVVAPVKEEKRVPMSDEEKGLFGIDKLNISRSDIPAITHVDYSARIQTVDGKYNQRYYRLIKQFYENTGCPVIVNTSFNVRGEPIVCTPKDAYRCFMRTEMDTLVLEDFVLSKSEQPEWVDKKNMSQRMRTKNISQRMRTKNIVVNISVLLCSIFLGFMAVEGYFRIFNPQSLIPVLFKEDPIYGLINIPGLKGYIKKPEFMFHFQLNSLGFRDKEPNKLKPESTYRIIGLGDSFTWGTGVKRNEIYLMRLEKSLNRDSNKVTYEVFNWAVGSWGTSQQLLLLKHQVIKYSPDLVVLQYFKGNDMSDNLRSNLFKISEKGELVPSSNYGYQKTRSVKKIVNNIPFYSFFVQRSHFFNFMRLKLIRITVNKDTRDVNAALPSSSSEEYSFRLTEKIMEEFFSIASNNGIKVILIVIPTYEESHPNLDKLSLVEKQKFINERAMLTNVCNRHNIPLVDLKSIFTSDDVSSIYYAVDGHLRPYGHILVSKILEEYIYYKD